VMGFPRHDGMTLIVRNVVADRHTLTRLHGKFSGRAGSEVALQSVLLPIKHLFAASTTAPTFESSIGSIEVCMQSARSKNDKEKSWLPRNYNSPPIAIEHLRAIIWLSLLTATSLYIATNSP
jgi:hypothetical protein